VDLIGHNAFLGALVMTAPPAHPHGHSPHPIPLTSPRCARNARFKIERVNKYPDKEGILINRKLGFGAFAPWGIERLIDRRSLVGRLYLEVRPDRKVALLKIVPIWPPGSYRPLETEKKD
jgi:hypothetical protein